MQQYCILAVVNTASSDGTRVAIDNEQHPRGETLCIDVFTNQVRFLRVAHNGR